MSGTSLGSAYMTWSGRRTGSAVAAYVNGTLNALSASTQIGEASWYLYAGPQTFEYFWEYNAQSAGARMRRLSFRQGYDNANRVQRTSANQAYGVSYRRDNEGRRAFLTCPTPVLWTGGGWADASEPHGTRLHEASPAAAPSSFWDLNRNYAYNDGSAFHIEASQSGVIEGY